MACRKPGELTTVLGHTDQPAGEAALAAAIPPRSAAQEEELLLQSHTSYYLPTKGSVCTARRKPEDRDRPDDLQRTCSRQAEALIAPDRYACRHPSTWPCAAGASRDAPHKPSAAISFKSCSAAPGLGGFFIPSSTCQVFRFLKGGRGEVVVGS